MSDSPDVAIFAKFNEHLDAGAMPVATLAMLWYIEPDGRDGVLSKFDGQQRISVTLGDLYALMHQIQHSDEEDE